MKYNVIACDHLFNIVLISFDNLYLGIHLYFLIVQILPLLVHIYVFCIIFHMFLGIFILFY